MIRSRDRREAVGAMGHGTNEAMERHGAGRAEGAGSIWSTMEREGRRGGARGRKGRRGRGGRMRPAAEKADDKGSHEAWDQ